MITKDFETREEWLAFREGKITGSKLGDLIVKRGTGRKIGFYELIKERLAIPEQYEDPMERGQRLESEAIEKFAEATGKTITNDLVMWISDIDPSIAYSPDGCISETEVVEIKCLSSARHLQAYFEKEVPSEYEEQNIQAFIVNEKLEMLHFAFYDPRIPSKPLHWITLYRADYEDKIEQYKEYQVKCLEEINKMVAELSF